MTEDQRREVANALLVDTLHAIHHLGFLVELRDPVGDEHLVRISEFNMKGIQIFFEKCTEPDYVALEEDAQAIEITLTVTI